MNEFAPLIPQLSAQLAGGQLSHAYIFQGAGAQEQAVALAAALCCVGREPRPCGTCPVCRNLLAESYPDCRIIRPDGASHRIDGMRALAMRAQMAPMDGEWKIFILDAAEKLQPDASNVMLKLLEEPPERTVLILITQQPEQLLPTIRSRCQLIMLGEGANNAAAEADPLLLAEAEKLLRDLPRLCVYEVLLLSRQREKKEEQHDFLFALLTVLHQAALGKKELPMEYGHLLRSETMVESALELADKNVSPKLLGDVVYLRLWQNSRG